MHLAILMTNTDDSAFARHHPQDGEKFSDMIHLVRPDWTLEVFPVKDGVFPDSLARFDGAIITGSPASVRSGARWIEQLLDLIRAMHAARLPLFGACFGHQAIALALGGTVGPNPGGLVHGLIRNETLARPIWARDLPDEVKLYGSHGEQVTSLPGGAIPLSRSEDCPVSGFALEHSVYTTQHHPEMTAAFIAALTEEMAEELGENLDLARASLSDPADGQIFAESIARFFEHAAAD